MSNARRTTAAAVIAIVALFVTPSTTHAVETPLDLEALIELAYSANPSYASTELDVERAEYQLDEARARQWPSLSVEGGLSYLFDPPDAVEFELNPADLVNPALLPPGPVESETVTLLPEGDPIQYSMDLTLEQPILTWGRIPTGIELAEVGTQAARLVRRRAARRLEAEVETLYYTVFYALELKREVDAQALLAERMVANMRASLDSGAITESQFRGFVVQLAETELGAVELETQIAQALAQLQARTGGTEVTIDRISFADIASEPGSALPEVTESPRALIPLAIANSDELALFDSRREAAELESRLAEAQKILRPSLSLQARIRMTGSAFEFGGQGFGEGFDVSPIVTFGLQATIFDGGASAAVARQREVAVEQARLERVETDLELQRLVRERAAALRLAGARAAQAESEMREAELLVVERERELERGAGSENALLEQRLAYHARRAAWLQQRLDYRRNFIELELIVGMEL